MKLFFSRQLKKEIIQTILAYLLLLAIFFGYVDQQPIKRFGWIYGFTSMLIFPPVLALYFIARARKAYISMKNQEESK